MVSPRLKRFSEPSAEGLRRERALRLILLLGVVSLLGDIVYEGCRGVVGPYLAFLGAGASAIGLLSGLGEFLGFALRLPFGSLSDRTRSYWGMTILGYGLLLSVPLLVLAGNWWLAAVLLLVERMGKALRSPARDTILSHATLQVGAGRGFAIHELLDQVGAIAGPLLFSLLLLRLNYRGAFSVMFFPFLLLMFFLILARRTLPQLPIESETKLEATKLEEATSLRWYNLFVFFSVAGLLPFPLLAYHLKVGGLVAESSIPLVYSLAMGADALMAYPIGVAFDRLGMVSLSLASLFSAMVPLAMLPGFPSLLLGAVALGFAISAHETVMRAAVAKLSASERRGRAYGGFQSVYGISYLLGNSICGLLYERGRFLLSLYVLVMEALSLLVLAKLTRREA